MSLESLIAELESFATLATPLNKEGVTREPAWNKACTLVTPITPRKELPQDFAQRSQKTDTRTAIATQAENDGLKACSWLVTFTNGVLLSVYVPAVDIVRVKADHSTMIGAEIAQSCGQCLWNLRPGQTDTGYCSSPDRHDQPGPYGEGHPARFLPEEGGAACVYFER
jgi:hypothetical protein